MVSGDHRDTCSDHNVLTLALGAHGGDGRGWGTDESDTLRGALFREGGILREKAIPWMDGLGPRSLCGPEDTVLTEVRFRRGGRTKTESLIGHTDMDGIPICLTVHGNSLNPKLLGRLDDSTGNLSSGRKGKA